MLIKSQKKVWLTFLAILIFFSAVTQSAFAAINVPPNSTDSSTPLTVTPSLDGSSTWYFDGYTEIVNSTTNATIGNTYRYKSSSGATVTMINPGSIGDWVDAFGGERHQVIGDYSSGKISTYNMAPPSPKTAYDRLKIDDIISASGVTSEYTNGKIYVKAPGDAPKITKFAVKEKPVDGKGCYPIKKAINIEIEVEQSDEKAPIKYVEVYVKDKNSASTLKKWDNVPTSNGKATLTVPYEVSMKEEVSFYVRAYDSRNRYDKDSQELNLTVGSIKPVGLNFKICGVVTSEADPDGTLPYFNHEILLKEDNLAGGKLLKRVDDTVGEHVLGRYRYPTLYDGKYGDSFLDKSTMSNQNTSFTVEVPFKNTGVDRSKITAAYKGQAFYHLVTEDVSTARNVIDVDRVSKDDFKNVYNGNPEYMATAVERRDIVNPDTYESYGNKYYYIRDLAYEAGGAADNVTGNDDFNSINPTWLRVLRTDWPDIVTFKLKQDKVKVGDSISFTMDGYEYVSDNRTKVDTTITIKKNDGSEVGSPIKTNLNSNKSQKNPKKPNQAEAGYWEKDGVPGPSITQKGLYTAELYIEDQVKRYAKATIKFSVGCDPNDKDPACSDKPEVTPASCEVIFVKEADGEALIKSLMEPSPSGSISSDSGEFDVVQGIPSSEYLRADAQSEEYTYEQDFVQRTGKSVFNGIKVSKHFDLTWETSWTDSDGDTHYTSHSDSEDKEVAINGIERPFTYWEILKYNIWNLTHSEFTNYALPGGLLKIDAITDVSADGLHSDVVEDHVFPPECVEIVLPSESIDGGSSRPSVPDITGEATAAAEAEIGDNEVENDRAEFKSKIIMDNVRTVTNGPKPTEIPDPGMIDMAQTGLQIDPLKTNYFESPSTGKVHYEPVFSIDNSATAQDFPFDVNPVTVHTPVVIYSKATDDKEHDQRIKPPIRSNPADPDKDRHAFILDRPFTVTMPTGGQHRDIPGYGNRDYAKYIKEKQVMFPFDVYTATKQGFYPANTWITVPVESLTADFFLPVWVPEGEYTIQFRAFAINALTDGDFGGSEHHANITIPNPAFNVPPAGSLSAAHVATDSIEVDVVGRLYDLHITDITDYNWKTAFRQSDGVTPNNNSYWVGLKGIDGDKRGNNNPFVLPVRHGSHPDGYQNVAVKTGYKFRFDMKTKGDMESIKDAIRITPRFYHVSKDGRNRQPVDLYYHDDNNYFVKIGSDKDKTYRTVSLNETLRNVPKNELANNASHYYNFADRFNLEETKNEFYETAFARNYMKHMSKEPTQTGPYGWQILNWKLRTYMGPLENQVPQDTMIPPKEVVSKEQTWYSEYSLPAKLYVVPQNSSVQEAGRVGMLNENHPLFLNNGYIIVNFDIETIQEGDVNNPYLHYYDAYYMSQWTDMEGFTSNFVDSYGNNFHLEEGDMIFYHADQSSLEDFKSSVTH
ncbi:DUF5704 domain-containing protein [Lysinibacillus sp. UGB7]|uniref:DUF5704 domain-containing protein n=1 Tax=Lysinibacillus sp. UGB7 TaxID=3411039 RepID=UPI003B820ED8